jgi:hypothetical protein
VHRLDRPPAQGRVEGVAQRVRVLDDEAAGGGVPAHPRLERPGPRAAGDLVAPDLADGPERGAQDRQRGEHGEHHGRGAGHGEPGGRDDELGRGDGGRGHRRDDDHEQPDGQADAECPRARDGGIGRGGLGRADRRVRPRDRPHAAVHPARAVGRRGGGQRGRGVERGAAGGGAGDRGGDGRGDAAEGVERGRRRHRVGNRDAEHAVLDLDRRARRRGGEGRGERAVAEQGRDGGVVLGRRDPEPPAAGRLGPHGRRDHRPARVGRPAAEAQRGRRGRGAPAGVGGQLGDAAGARGQPRDDDGLRPRAPLVVAEPVAEVGVVGEHAVEAAGQPAAAELGRRALGPLRPRPAARRRAACAADRLRPVGAGAEPAAQPGGQRRQQLVGRLLEPAGAGPRGEGRHGGRGGGGRGGRHAATLAAPRPRRGGARPTSSGCRPETWGLVQAQVAGAADRDAVAGRAAGAVDGLDRGRAAQLAAVAGALEHGPPERCRRGHGAPVGGGDGTGRTRRCGSPCGPGLLLTGKRRPRRRPTAEDPVR